MRKRMKSIFNHRKLIIIIREKITEFLIFD